MNYLSRIFKTYVGARIPGLWGFSRRAAKDERLQYFMPSSGNPRGSAVISFNNAPPSEIRDTLRKAYRLGEVPDTGNPLTTAVIKSDSSSETRAWHLRAMADYKNNQRLDISRIYHDIDPMMRAILIRLLSLSFISYVGNNCSGHRDDNRAYLNFRIKADSEEDLIKARKFCDLVRHVEIFNDTSGKIIYFVRMPSPEKIKIGETIGVILMITKSDPQIKDSEWFPNNRRGKLRAEDYVRIWEAFDEIIALFKAGHEKAFISPTMLRRDRPAIFNITV